jgi:ribosomal-protein-alanine N-acetyltransferase
MMAALIRTLKVLLGFMPKANVLNTPINDPTVDVVLDLALPTTGTVRIRPMQEEDIEPVHAIDVLSFSTPWPAASYRFELFENPASMLWVAEAELPDEKKRVIGMVVVWLLMDEAHIATIAIHPDYRGQGISNDLMAVALMESARKGADKATLEVRAGNQVAQALYQHFGFRVVGRRPKYYQDNYEDALIMAVEGFRGGQPQRPPA